MLGTVVVGVIFTDFKGFSSTEYIPEGRNVGKVEITHGGVSRNIAENIAVSGMPVTFVSMTEKNAMGKEVVDRLNSCGVNTEFILPTSGNGIGKWMVILDEKGNVAGQISYPPEMQPLTDFISAYGKEFVRDANQIILEIDIGEETARRVLDLADTYHKKVYAIVGNLSVLLTHQELIRRTHCFICNEFEISKLFGCDMTKLPAEDLLTEVKKGVLLRDYPATVVTIGERGCVYFDPKTGESGMTPAIRTEMVDSSGAGDAFLSGAVMGLSKGLSLREATVLGTRLASLTVASKQSSCPKNTLPHDYLEELAGNCKELPLAL